jgi:hypothetical protein
MRGELAADLLTVIRAGFTCRGVRPWQRRRLKNTVPLEERLAEEARQLREKAEALPNGPQREALLQKARQQDETASHVTKWLTSPGLQPPK